MCSPLNVNYSFNLGRHISFERDWPSRYALCLWDPPNPQSELYTRLAAEHPRQHNRRGLCPDCSAARQKARWSWVRSTAETRPLTSPGDVTLFPHCVSCRLGLLSFILSHYKLLKIFARSLHMLLRIDHISTCVIHLKCTFLLEGIIISWHIGDDFL